MSLDHVGLGVPVLNLARFRAGGGTQDRFLDDLRKAAREVGFFHLVGHGVPEAAFERMFHLARAVFALPEADKAKIAMVNSPRFRGWNRAGAELTRGLPDWREQLDIGPERPAAAELPADAPPWARLRGPNQWPAALPELRLAALSWLSRLDEIAVELLEAFALALGQPADALDPIHRAGPHSLVKLIRYPARDTVESDQGVGAHKDSGFVTLLAQDEVGGLEVETEAGWIPVAPLPGAFVVNVGEILELASNGYLRATVHRVVSPPQGVERLSIAHFFGADLDASAPLLPLPPELASAAKGLSTDPANPLFRELGRNYLKGRLRSHPDVAERWHSDLVAAGWAG